MATRTEPVHDWCDLWDNACGKKRWASKYPKRNRSAFELEIEGTIEASIPSDLGSLLRSYHACTWNWTVVPPENPLFPAEVTEVDLHSSLEVASYMEADLEVNDVLVQLRGQVYDHFSRLENGILISPPSVDLPFPEEHLETFVQDLKAYAALTLWHHAHEYPAFLASLPKGMLVSLTAELFQLALLLLIKRLRSAATPNRRPEPPLPPIPWQ
jgi:hypothetical protein